MHRQGVDQLVGIETTAEGESATAKRLGQQPAHPFPVRRQQFCLGLLQGGFPFHEGQGEMPVHLRLPLGQIIHDVACQPAMTSPAFHQGKTGRRAHIAPHLGDFPGNDPTKGGMHRDAGIEIALFANLAARRGVVAQARLVEAGLHEGGKGDAPLFGYAGDK